MGSQQTTSLFNGEVIDLTELIQTLWKKRVWIATACLLVTSLAAIIAYNKSPFFKTSAIIKLTELGEKKDGTPQFIDSIENIKAIIGSGALNNTIDNQYPAMSLDFNAIQVNDSSLLEIRLNTPSRQMGISSVEKLIETLNRYYASKVNSTKLALQQKRTQLENKITDSKTDKAILLDKQQFLENDIKNIQAQKKLLNNEIDKIGITKSRIDAKEKKIQTQINKVDNSIKLVQIAKQEIHYQEDRQRIDIGFAEKTSTINDQALIRLRKEVREVEQNTSSMLNNNKKILKAKPTQSEAIALLMYSNSIQQNLSLLDTMNTRIEKLLTESAREKSQILKLKLGNKGLLQNLARKDIEISNILAGKKLLEIDLANSELERHELSLKTADLQQSLTKLDVEIANKKLAEHQLTIQAKKFDTLASNTNAQLKQVESELRLFKPFEIINEASASLTPIYPPRLKMVFAAFLCSLLLSAMVVLFYTVLMGYYKKSA